MRRLTGTKPLQVQDGGGSMPERLLTTAEAAEYLGTTPRVLESWRFTGGGPVYRKLGRRLVRYVPDDLAAFIDQAARVNTGGGRPPTA